MKKSTKDVEPVTKSVDTVHSSFEERMKLKSDDLMWVLVFWIFGTAASIWFLTHLGQSLLVELLPVATGVSSIGPTIING